jgi:hypothetical protein
LYIAAHPDDENTRLISHLAKNKARTDSFLNEGDGGPKFDRTSYENSELFEHKN